jgi:TetR/AcrR family transcriptional repressor of lfrA
MTTSSTPDSGSRGRTRTAILTAAMTVLAVNPAASLADIAAAAEVGRSTLHRYFSERSDLLRELALHVHELAKAAIDDAEPDCGPPIEALRRVVEGQLALGPIVLFVYSTAVTSLHPDLRDYLDGGDEGIVEVLQQVSAADPAGPPDWARRVFWALLDAGFEAVRDGTPRVQVVDAIMASLTRGTINPNRSSDVRQH